jgi:predicted nuclease of restriction endonuclease-like RecB superfamily
VQLQVSGPFSLFRHTQVYRRALVALLPRLTWCRRFELNAECPLRGSSASVHFTLKSGDPIGVARALSARRAKTEERFVRDFARQAPDWELSADPAPLRAGSRLISADFALTRRGEPSQTVLLAIAGYWTSHFVRDLQRDLAGAGLPPLILCLDENKACDGSALAAGERVLRFRGRIAVRELLSLLESDLS